MRAVLLDTHAWAWSLTGDARLSAAAVAALEQAETVFLSAISLFEIGQKVRLGKWPQMESHVARLVSLAEEQGVRIVDLSAVASLAAATMDWSHRDPFDRIIGATAIIKGVPVVSADSVFDSITDPQWPGRIWAGSPVLFSR